MDFKAFFLAAALPFCAQALEARVDDVDADRNLFQSDMTLMTGMTPADRGMSMPGWHVMDLGVATGSYNHQGGPSGGSEIESSNWNMIHAQKGLGPGRLSLMMMNSLEPATYPKPARASSSKRVKASRANRWSIASMRTTSS